jgi:hypothetical protein
VLTCKLVKTIQVISLDGHPVALIAGDKAIISDRVTSRDRLHVQAKAHFALRILAGELPSPYTDEDAEDYARAAASVRISTTHRDLRQARRRGHTRRPSAR